MSQVGELQKQIADLKKQIADLKKDVAGVKWLLTSLDQVVTKFKKTFENHTHRLNGYTSEGVSMVQGGNKNLIYLHRSNTISDAKRDLLKQTAKPALE